MQLQGILGPTAIVPNKASAVLRSKLAVQQMADSTPDTFSACTVEAMQCAFTVGVATSGSLQLQDVYNKGGELCHSMGLQFHTQLTILPYPLSCPHINAMAP